MARNTDAIRGELTAQSKATIAKLAKADLMPDLRREMRDATKELQPAVRRAVRALPSSRSRRKTPGGSLRNAVANIIVRKIKMSPREVLVVITAAMHGGKGNLARVLEGDIPWKHPVYGHEGSEVKQKAEPYFDRTLDPLLPGVESQIQSILAKLEKKL